MNKLPIGTILNGKYTIREVKGCGSFGITYKGWDGAIGRFVAIKEYFPGGDCKRDLGTNDLIPVNPENHETCQLQLRKEANTLAACKHAGVVAVHDIFAANNTLYIVMEWLPGESLQSIMDKKQSGEYAPVSQDEVRAWLCYILQALKGIHSKNIFHRDIKPDNIVFDEDGNPKLVDFGSALNRNTQIGQTIVGSYTPAYAAPEQLTGMGKMGPWTDFFALAATFYELITGLSVRSGQEAELPYPLHLAHRLAESIMRNLQMDPRARCQNADEWLEMITMSSDEVKLMLCELITKVREHATFADVREKCLAMREFWVQHFGSVPSEIENVVKAVEAVIAPDALAKVKNIRQGGAIAGGAIGAGLVGTGAAIGAGVGQGIVGAVMAAIFGGPVVLPIALAAGGAAALGLAAKAWFGKSEEQKTQEVLAEFSRQVCQAVDECWPAYTSKWRG